MLALLSVVPGAACQDEDLQESGTGYGRSNWLYLSNILLMTVNDILVEADRLVNKNELLNALKLLLRLEEKRLGKDIYTSLENLYKEVQKLENEPKSQATELDLQEIAELTLRHIDDIEYVYGDVDLMESGQWFSDKIRRLKIWFNSLGQEWTVHDEPIPEKEGNSPTNSEEDEKILITPRHKEAKTGSISELEPKRLKKEIILLSFIVLVVISYVVIGSKLAVSGRNYSTLLDDLTDKVVPAADSLNTSVSHEETVKKPPGIYLTSDVSACYLITKDVLEVVAFNKSVHVREKGIYYKIEDIVNVFKFRHNLKKGTRLTSDLVGSCTN